MSDTASGGGYVACVSMDNAYKAIDIYNRKRIHHRFGGKEFSRFKQYIRRDR
jgi:hypothetical protein